MKTTPITCQIKTEEVCFKKIQYWKKQERKADLPITTTSLEHQDS
jgi:hypothetical protein